MRNDQKTMVEFGRSSFRELFERRNLFIQAVRQDKTSQRRDLQPKAGALLFHIRPAKQQQRGRLARRIFPVAFNGGNFGGLVL
jgi:hypothetical protein